MFLNQAGGQISNINDAMKLELVVANGVERFLEKDCWAHGCRVIWLFCADVVCCLEKRASIFVCQKHYTVAELHYFVVRIEVFGFKIFRIIWCPGLLWCATSD
jgi:hypothetical protein